MSKFVESACRADIAAGAIAQYLRVKTPGALVVATAADVAFGTMENPCVAAGPCAVRLRTAQGTRKFVAAGAITAGNPFYAAAGGKVAATGTSQEGIALETTSADGEVFEGVVAAGHKIARGQATTVTASDTIVTGLGALATVVVSMENDPVDDPFMCSAQIGDQAGAPAAGSFLLKTWKNTGGTDPTPLAATTFSKKVNWIAFATL